jgi:hypothetical protein
MLTQQSSVDKGAPGDMSRDSAINEPSSLMVDESAPMTNSINFQGQLDSLRGDATEDT